MRTPNNLQSILLLLVPVLLAAGPVPLEHAISARVETTLSIPAGQDPMQMPTDVAVDSKLNVFIADGVNARIVRLDSNGKSLPPLKPGLSSPTGLFIDHKDRLWVADSGHHRAVQLDAGGKIEQDIELPPDAGKSAKPTDLLLTADGARLYVVDNANHRILIRDQKSGQWTIAGSPGKSLGQLQYPFMIAQGREGAVHITETIGTRVQTLTADRQWGRPISGWGISLGRFCRPKGIAVDSAGRIFVSDSTLRVVQVFSPDGKLDGVLTDADHNVLRFEHPMGMTFDSKGRLYVVELKANRVAVASIGARSGGTP